MRLINTSLTCEKKKKKFFSNFVTNKMKTENTTMIYIEINETKVNNEIINK